MWNRTKTARHCPDPHHVGGKPARPTRTPEEHRRAVAALNLQPEQSASEKANRLGKAGWRRVLHEMGYASYEEYLQSDLWMRIRKKVLKKARKLCADCPSRATQVHHEAYTVENLKGMNLRFLVAVCDDCHHKRHGLKTRR